MDVTATWWPTDGQGISYNSKTLTWRLQTRKGKGSRVTDVEAPKWCGGYVRLDACAI
ncbi:hypothetical protein GCM10010166_10810 [Couchioplanes caeruleus subsp. azureus]|nr:hypothetical protein GCM10010166_10810 [Couchioplanes caeruleus subsp. azureus]